MIDANNWEDSWKDLRQEDFQRIGRQIETQPLSLASGGILKRFEKLYAKFAGAQFAVATNNGTAAIYAALWAAGVSPGDEVLVCDYGFIAMAGAITTLKATMVPVDINPSTLTMDPDDLRQKITSKARAVLVHNPWGVLAELDEIRNATDLPVILDASHAHGAMYKDKPLSDWADVACYSLGKGKLITGGELGCAITNSAEYRDRMIILGHTNRTPHDLVSSTWRFNNVGLKLRPHVVALEIALCQLKRFQNKKTLLVTTCSKIESIFSEYGFIPQAVVDGGERVYWRIVFHLDELVWENFSVTQIESALKEAGIPVEANHYWPLLQHQAPFLWEGQEAFIRPIECPVALKVTQRLITVPAPVELSEAQIDGIRLSLVAARQALTDLYNG